MKELFLRATEKNTRESGGNRTRDRWKMHAGRVGNAHGMGGRPIRNRRETCAKPPRDVGSRCACALISRGPGSRIP